MISPSQRPLPDNTQHSQQTNIHALGVIRTHDRSRRAAEDLCLRPRGHWDRLLCEVNYTANNVMLSLSTRSRVTSVKYIHIHVNCGITAISFKWISCTDVTRVLADKSNITLVIVWFTSQRKVFNLKMAHERAETCH